MVSTSNAGGSNSTTEPTSAEMCPSPVPATSSGKEEMVESSGASYQHSSVAVEALKKDVKQLVSETTEIVQDLQRGNRNWRRVMSVDLDYAQSKVKFYKAEKLFEKMEEKIDIIETSATVQKELSPAEEEQLKKEGEKRLRELVRKESLCAVKKEIERLELEFKAAITEQEERIDGMNSASTTHHNINRTTHKNTCCTCTCTLL